MVEKSCKKKTEKKLAAREEAKLLAGFMGVMNNMRKQVPPVWEWRTAWRGVRVGGGGGVRTLAPCCLGRSARALWTQSLFFLRPRPSSHFHASQLL